MEKIAKEIIRELAEKYGKKELLLQIMFDMCVKKNYTYSQAVKMIDEFLGDVA